jgi:hypothetical protein
LPKTVAHGRSARAEELVLAINIGPLRQQPENRPLGRNFQGGKFAQRPEVVNDEYFGGRTVKSFQLP